MAAQSISSIIHVSNGRNTRQSGLLSINSLPDSILQFIGEYLPNSSGAMMASALSRACFESDTLDFSDINRNLASKLSDSDISDILVSIDALNRLKVLKLIGCENISGIGLEPLRRSTTLQQIDLSTSVKATIADCKDLFSPNFPWSFSLQEDAVIPVLNSIIAEKGSSLKHIQFPLVWRRKKSDLLISFLERYNSALDSRMCSCVICSEGFQTSSWINRDKFKNNSNWGLQRHTCYECTGHTCEECEGNFCDKCMKQFCGICSDVECCEYCSAVICNKCGDLDVCDGCGVRSCPDCMYIEYCECCDLVRCSDCVPHWHCSNCWRSNCDDCAHAQNVQWCEVCEEEHCNDCRLKDYNNGNLECTGCRGLLLPRIMQEKEVMTRENEMLKFLVANALEDISQDPSKVLHLNEVSHVVEV